MKRLRNPMRKCETVKVFDVKTQNCNQLDTVFG